MDGRRESAPAGKPPAPEAPDAATRSSAWPIGLGVVIGAVIGLSLGASSQSLGSHYEGGLPRNLGPLVTTGAAVVISGLLGLLLLIPGSTRRIGQGLFVAALSIIAGFVLAGLVVPRNPGPQSLGGTLRLALTSPLTQAVAAAATCETPSAPDRAFVVYATLGRLGSDDLAVNLVHFGGQASASLQVRVNGTAGYRGSAQIVDVSPDLRTGSVAFTGLQSSAAWIGGEPGNLLSGTLSWDCR